MSNGSDAEANLAEFLTKAEQRLVEESSIPLYHQLYRILQKYIEGQGLQQGDRFPSEEAISSCFGVSRPTASKAVQELLNQGWLVRERGRGTFVHREPLVSLALLSNNLSLTEQFPPNATLSTKLIRRKVSPAVPEIAHALHLDATKPVIYLRRLRFVDERPVMVCDAYLAADRFSSLGEQGFVRGSLYATLEERHDCIIDRSERQVEATEVVEQEVADLLGIPLFSPILVLSGLTFISSEEPPIEYMVSYIKEGVAFKSTVRRPEHRESLKGADICSQGLSTRDPKAGDTP